MKTYDFIVSCNVKLHEHTNPDGTKIKIRGLDIGNYSFWDELVQEWVSNEQAKKRLKEKTLVLECHQEYFKS